MWAGNPSGERGGDFLESTLREILVDEPLLSPRRPRVGATRYVPWLWAVGAALYGGVLWYVGWEDLRGAFGAIALPWLLAMVGVELVVLWGRAWKWRYGIGRGGEAIRLYFLAKASGNVTPGRVGELSPLLLARHRSPRTAAWIVLDRVLEIAATLLVGALGAVVVGVAFAESLHLEPWMIAAGWAAALGGMVLLPLFLVTRHRWLTAGADRMPDGSRIQRAIRWLADVSHETRLFRSRAPLLALLTFGATVADVVIGMLLYISFGYWLPFALLAAAQCLHALVSAVPITPNATGVPYLATAVLLYKVGGVPPEVLALAIPVRIVVGGTLFWISFALAMVVGRRSDG